MRTHKYKGLMSTIKYNICGDGYDAEVRANNIFNVAKNRIDKAYEQSREDAIDEFVEKANLLLYDDFNKHNVGNYTIIDVTLMITRVAEQLKEQ